MRDYLIGAWGMFRILAVMALIIFLVMENIRLWGDVVSEMTTHQLLYMIPGFVAGLVISVLSIRRKSKSEEE